LRIREARGRKKHEKKVSREMGEAGSRVPGLPAGAHQAKGHSMQQVPHSKWGPALEGLTEKSKLAAWVPKSWIPSPCLDLIQKVSFSVCNFSSQTSPLGWTAIEVRPGA
jgi:hypothetical protein